MGARRGAETQGKGATMKQPPFLTQTPAQRRRKHHVNLELTTTIRTAINNTLSSLRPPVSGTHLPEPARTALQTHLDALLKEELQALTGQASHTPLYERLWCQATRDLDAAMDLVQRNSEFFGAQVGDDKIKVIGEFFIKWAPVMMKPGVTLTVDTRDLHAELCRIQATILERKADVVKDPLGRTYIDPRKDALWYPDDSGEWVEVSDDCMACPVPEDTVVGYLLRREREWKDYCAYPNTASDVCWDLDPEENERIVAYKVVKP